MKPPRAASPGVFDGRTLLPATFEARPNRFVARCTLDRREVLAHVASTGRLGGLLVPGATVLLEPKAGEGRKLAFTLVAVESGGALVHLEAAASNGVAARLLEEGRIRLEGVPRVVELRREVTVGAHRFDLAVRGPKDEVLVEVKACTELSPSFAMFPDAATERGRRHVEALGALARGGRRTAVLFLVQSARPRWFLPDYHVDPAFAAALHAVREDVEVAAWGVTWPRTGAGEVRRLEIPWDLYTREAGNHGAYLLHLHLARAKTVEIGALGPVRFPAGHYLYAGSAKKNLAQRIARHRRLKKQLHWHIDHLRAEAKVLGDHPFATPADLEHELAAGIAALSSWAVPGFGCSDCRCPSHLYGFAEDPTRLPGFWRLVHHLRRERLAP